MENVANYAARGNFDRYPPTTAVLHPWQVPILPRWMGGTCVLDGYMWWNVATVLRLLLFV